MDRNYKDTVLYLPESFVKKAEDAGTTEEVIYEHRVQIYENRIFRGNKFDFLVLSRQAALNTLIEENHIVISITDKDKILAYFPENSYRKDILRLQFYDVDEGADAITASDVAKIKSFMNNLKYLQNIWTGDQELKLIVVHCEGGISRSSGLAAALSKIYNNEDSYFFKNYVPNPLVYRKVLEGFNI